MPVHWLINAAESLRAATHREFMKSDDACAQLQARLGDTLAQVFPDQVVIVRDRFAGYREFNGLVILLVEVQPGTAAANPGPFHSPGIYIVKIAYDDRAKDLRDELSAWDAARPPHVRSDNIFVSLDPYPPRESGKPPVAIVYGDANTVLGSRNVLSLEEAVTRSCKFGQPRPQSITRLFHTLYERLGSHFFRRSCAVEPSSYLSDAALPSLTRVLLNWHEPRPEGEALPFTPRAGETVDAHAESRRQIRRETLGLLCAEHAAYADPIDYLTGVWQLRDAQPPVAPPVLRGFAHGDMHARNIQVSVLDDDVSQCSVFDYEQMRRDNFVAWDFVKMELELAVRFLNDEGASERPEFIRQALTFWRFVAARIAELERHQAPTLRDDHRTPDAADLLPRDPQLARQAAALPRPLQRLARTIVALRRQAGRQLGGDWLPQYDFLTAWYACRAGLYPNYKERMVTAALIAAGVSARRLIGTSHAGPAADRRPGEMCHRPRFLYARTLARGGDPADRDDGVRRLEALRRDYPHVIEIEEELALGYIEQKRFADAEQVLRQIADRFRHTTAEAPARMGALWKRRALAESRHDLNALRTSLDWYRRAEAVAGEYFPAINVATLLWLLGDKAAARAQAGRVLEILNGVDPAADPFWPLATRGEALLLMGDPGRFEEAMDGYRRAVAERDCAPRDQAAMRRQLEWLRPHLEHSTQVLLTDGVLDQVFPNTPQKTV